MDENKQPGIRFMGVELRNLMFGIHGPLPGKLPFAPSVTMQGFLSSDEKQMDFHFTMDLFGSAKAEEKPPVDFRFTLIGHFSVAPEVNMTLREFGEHHAPGLLFPYVRELISNLSARTVLPHLNLAPVNVFAWVKTGRATLTMVSAAQPQSEVGGEMKTSLPAGGS